MIIQPVGGLANRLRVIFSYNEYAKKINEKLNVIWNIALECPGHFLDFFEPVENMSFISTKPKGKRIDYVGCHVSPQFSPNYGKLLLSSDMQNETNERIKRMGSYYFAAHVRRTDMVQHLAIKGIPSIADNQFISFLQESPRKCFVATDNRQTQKLFEDALKEKIVVFNTIEEVDVAKKHQRFRHTSLQESIYDIYLCVNSKKFMGTPGSSFSGLIENLRMVD